MTDSTFRGKKILYITLGCKLNFAETSTIGKALEKRGAETVKKGEVADICIINTCSVTELSDKKCRQIIRRTIKNNPHAVVVVTGCYAQLKPENIATIEGVDLVVGNGEKANIDRYINDLFSKIEQRKIITTPSEHIEIFSPSLSRGEDRTRYFLKVQDGCNYFCSYCTVPLARGRSRNGSIDSLVEQAKEVARSGGKEIVLSGVNIGDFGKSTGETFLELIQCLDQIESIRRFRISSIEPNLLSDEIIHFVAKSKRFAPHFHIPLQSGSDAVLKLMRRRYDTALFAHRIATIKSLMPNAFIGVDIIVGMRGETDALFEESYHFVESLPISQLHVFSYSERPGTDALKITPIVTAEDKQQRSNRFIELSNQKLKTFYTSQIGNVVEVLFEHTPKNKLMCGFSDNYIRVEMPYDTSLINQICSVRLENIDSKTGFFKGVKIK